jgi:RND family efflux transporter MFP subunit
MKLRISYLVTIAFVVFALAGCSILPTSRPQEASQDSSGDSAEPTPIPTPIVPAKPTYTVQQGDVVKKLEFTGRVSPVNEKALFFRTSGRIRQVLAKRNDPVTKDQLIADLEIDELERQQAAARLELERAQQRLAEAEANHLANIRRAEVNLELAQLALAAEQNRDFGPQRTQAELDLRQAEVALKQAQEAYNAIAWRNDRGSTMEALNLEQATISFERARAAYDAAMQGLDQNKYAIATQQRQVELAQLSLEELQRGVDPLLKNDVDRAQLELERVTAAISDSQIAAPFDGKVLSIALTEGRPVEAFNEVVTVADPSELEIAAELQSTDMQDLAEGMPATMVLVSRPGETFEGEIRKLPYPYGSGGGSANVEEEDKTTRVTMEGSLEEAGLELGDLMRVTVVLEQKPGVLWLPPQAIRTFEGRNFVVIQDGDGQRRVDVKVGIKSDDRVEILEGLEAGQIIVGR